MKSKKFFSLDTGCVYGIEIKKQVRNISVSYFEDSKQEKKRSKIDKKNFGASLTFCNVIDSELERTMVQSVINRICEDYRVSVEDTELAIKFANQLIDEIVSERKNNFN